MVEPVDVIGGLETAAPILGGFSTLVLAVLYWMQHGKLSEQANILKEQQKVSKLEQTPNLVGPYNWKYDAESENIYLDLSNIGRGPARFVTLYMEFVLPNFPIEIRDCKITFSREDVAFMEPNTIYPNESEVTFVADTSDLEVEIIDNNDSSEIFEANIEDVTKALAPNQTDIINIRYRVEYADIFAEYKNPFGRDYVVRSPTSGFSPSMGYRRHLELRGLASHASLD